MNKTFFLFLLFLFLIACTQQAQVSKTTNERLPLDPAPPTKTAPVIAPPYIPSVVEINMIAKKFDFVPSEIKVKKGDTVRLKVKSIDVPHGIAIREYDIKVGLPAGEEKAVEFVADKTGEFEFYCSVYCGSGHGMMRGKLIVE